jgi:hypothetical protein
MWCSGSNQAMCRSGRSAAASSKAHKGVHLVDLARDGRARASWRASPHPAHPAAVRAGPACAPASGGMARSGLPRGACRHGAGRTSGCPTGTALPRRGRPARQAPRRAWPAAARWKQVHPAPVAAHPACQAASAPERGRRRGPAAPGRLRESRASRRELSSSMVRACPCMACSRF